VRWRLLIIAQHVREKKSSTIGREQTCRSSAHTKKGVKRGRNAILPKGVGQVGCASPRKEERGGERGLDGEGVGSAFPPIKEKRRGRYKPS